MQQLRRSSVSALTALATTTRLWTHTLALAVIAVALVACGPADNNSGNNNQDNQNNFNTSNNNNGNTSAICGDGLVQTGEDCDGDGAGAGGETATCNSDCTLADCGDGLINATAGEACDDGNNNNRDDCLDGTDGTCQAASCSDGFLHDQGTGDESDVDCGGACGSTCAFGDNCNGPTDCQSGNCIAGVCVAASCGDGIVQTGEECDGDGAGTAGETATCDSDCTFVVCGDGTVNASASEACDDGNGVNNDDCPDGAGGTCLAATCSDGFLHDQGSGDESDVDCGGTCGSTCANGDNCNSGTDCISGSCPAGACVAASCGDGIVQTGEDCDGDGAGTGGETATCDSDCTSVVCGDGTINTTAGEACDDGNGVNNDDCPDGTGGTCLAATCNDGFLHDQGSGDESDVDCGGSCGSTCTTGDNCNSPSDCASGACPAGVCVVSFCGDGLVQTGEDCDGDGAGTGGETSTCDSDCTFVQCGDATINTTAGEQCDDGNSNNNDDCPDGTGGTCQDATCDDGFLHNQGNGSETDVDCGGSTCFACPGGLLLSEVVVTPTLGEFIEVHNPSSETVSLGNVYLADYNAYHTITTGTPTAPGAADFRVRFPAGTTLAAGARIVVSVETASDFNTIYGSYPDFDFDAADANAPAMVGELSGSSGLTNGDEMVALFFWDGSSAEVSDIDYLLWGNTSDAMDKTGVGGYLPDTATGSQDYVSTHSNGSSLERCDDTEGTETTTGGNGYLGHDETSENLSATWEVSLAPTPGAANLCSYLNTIVIDGVNDFIVASEQFPTTAGGYTGYVTWDQTYLYIGMDGPDVNMPDGSRLLLIYLDAGGFSTYATGRLYNTQQPMLPFGASFLFHWRSNNADTAAYTTDGSSWNLHPTWNWTGDVFQSGNYVELRLPLADIGATVPANVNVHLSMVNTTGGGEWTYAGVPNDSFTSGYDPDYTRYFSFAIGGSTPPNSHVSQ